MKETQEPTRARVAVVVDSSPGTLASLEAAAALAARRHASLEAVFVEDLALFELAALPFARELDRASGSVRPMSTAHVEVTLRAHLARVRQALERAGAASRVQTSVRVTRGHYVSAALDAASHVDVLFFSRAQLPGAALGSVARVKPTPKRARSVWAIYDGSEPGRRALELAREMATQTSAPLSVLLVSDDPAELARVSEGAQEVLGGFAPARVLRATSSDAAALREPIFDRPSLLLVPRALAARAKSSTAPLLEAVECPVVLVS
jgi:nucleotide-binding universal stress UspA family protein